MHRAAYKGSRPELVPRCRPTLLLFMPNAPAPVLPAERRPPKAPLRQRRAEIPSPSPERDSFVIRKWLGLELAGLLEVLEDMGYPNRGRDPLNPALH